METYEGFEQRQQPEPRKTRRGRGIAMVLVGALVGSVIGGGGVALYLNGSQGVSAAQQAYIDQAVSDAADGLASNANSMSAAGDGGTVDDTVYNEVNLVTTDYSATVQNVAKSVSASVVGIATSQGTGTGVIVSSDGLIVTNEHVIAINDETQMFRPNFGSQTQTDTTITVTLVDGTQYTAQVLFSDEAMDLAVIKIDAKDLKPAKLGNSDGVSVGEITIAIGNPLGLEQTVTSGIVSALKVSAAISNTQVAEELIQTDAAINPGNSGGALLNAAGEVIGINSYKLSNGEGIGFAIPINAAKPILDQIISTGEFKQVKLGMSLVDKELLSYTNYDISLESGVYVYDVDSASNAAAQGLKKGDVITAIDGAEVNSILEIKEQIYAHLPGDSVTLTVQRSSDTVDIKVVLGEAK